MLLQKSLEIYWMHDVPIIIDALGTVTKELSKGLEDLEIKERVETIQTTALLRSARILCWRL